MWEECFEQEGDVVIRETNRWDNSLTYFFIWTTWIRKKDDWREKESSFLMCFNSLGLLYSPYFAFFLQPVIHVT